MVYEVQRFAARFSLALPSEDELLSIVRDEATRWSERNRGARVRTATGRASSSSIAREISSFMCGL